MARMSHWLGLVAVGLTLTGCVTQEKYNALKLDRDAQAERLGQAEAEARAARAEAEVLRNQIGAIMSGGSGKDGMIVSLTNQNADLARQLEELNAKYASAMGMVGKSSPLPPALTNELNAFAAANPDLVEFDSARGIVKFKSDVTFALGSAEMTPKAKEVIARFSQILNSSAASGYELLVAGHTDNVRVANPATIAAGHKDNWYLSAHRAISVGGELQAHRVSPQRLGVVGYADQRPIASNGSDSGRAQNRRVEVLILPTQVRGAAVTSTPAPRGAPASPANLNKETMTTINPALNK